jgi:D-arginine dehydrogenase
MSDDSFDVAIIGAGIAGASLAAEIAQSRRVAIVEAEPIPGLHSTGRSAALFTTAYEGSLVRRLTLASRGALQVPRPEISNTSLLRPRACLYVGRAEQATEIETLHREFVPHCSQLRIVRNAELERLASFLRPGYASIGLLDPDAADIDVAAFHRGCLRAAKAAGAALFLSAPVSALEFSHNRWRIVTTEHDICAETVVNAAGAWAEQIAELAGRSLFKLTPCRRTLVCVDQPAGVGSMDLPMIVDVGMEFYFKPETARMLISSADETPVVACDVQPEELDIAVAVDAYERVTGVAVKRIISRWAGLRTFTSDRMPIVGYDDELPNFFWIAGQGGSGIQTAPALTAIGAALLLGGDPGAFAASYGIDVSELSVARLSPAERLNGAGAAAGR